MFFIYSPFDVLNPFHPFDVRNPFYPFDAVDVRFGANLLVPAHPDVSVVVDVEFASDVHDVLSSLMLSLLMSILGPHSPRRQRVCRRELFMKIPMRCLSPSDKGRSRN